MTQLERTSRFVAPLPEDRRPIVEVLPPMDPPALLPTSTSHVELRTGYTDRAKGFQLATVPVALAFGVGVLVVAMVGFSVPAFSVAALTVFWVLSWPGGSWAGRFTTLSAPTAPRSWARSCSIGIYAMSNASDCGAMVFRKAVESDSHQRLAPNVGAQSGPGHGPA